MDVPEKNPYRPPSPLPEIESGDAAIGSSATMSIESLLRAGPIDFSGRAGREDLEEYLRADGDLGCVFPMSLTAFSSLVLLLMIGIGGSRFAPLALGIVGMLVIGLLVSTRAYRRSLFQNRHPDWDQPVHGQIRFDGMTICFGGTTTHYQWNGLAGVESTEQLIAVESVIPKGRVILLTPTMMYRLDGWSTARSVFRWWGNAMRAGADVGDLRVQRRILRDANRQRTANPPPDAITFSGPIHSSDFVSVVDRRFHRRRPIRAHVVRLTMLVLVVGSSFESVRLLLPDARVWQLILAAYVVTGVLWFTMLSYRGGKKSRLLHHVHGFIDSDGITTDLGIVSHQMPWSAMSWVDRNDDHITLARRDGWQWLHLKKIMFADDEAWQKAVRQIEVGIG